MDVPDSLVSESCHSFCRFRESSRHIFAEEPLINWKRGTAHMTWEAGGFELDSRPQFGFLRAHVGEL